MTDEEAMEALLNSDGYSFPTWTLKLGLPTDEMRLVMSLIASDKAPIPVDVAYISEYLHMDGAVVESSVKELLDRRLVYKNQLNEGVHIKGVDAVIMVRRTSSPTIFYQQLGRALTAAGNFEPLVIDLVDNFEMIGIEQIVNMMSESYARLSDENDPKELIPPSAFKVIDHEKDARHLAKNLERRLALRSEKLTIDEKIALWKGL